MACTSPELGPARRGIGRATTGTRGTEATGGGDTASTADGNSTTTGARTATVIGDTGTLGVGSGRRPHQSAPPSAAVTTISLMAPTRSDRPPGTAGSAAAPTTPATPAAMRASAPASGLACRASVINRSSALAGSLECSAMDILTAQAEPLAAHVMTGRVQTGVPGLQRTPEHGDDVLHRDLLEIAEHEHRPLVLVQPIK